MMSGNNTDFGDAGKFVDWDAHSGDQSASNEPQQPSESLDKTHQNITYGNPGKMTDTFLGPLSDEAIKNAIAGATNPESYKEAIDLGVGGGGMEVVGKLAKPAISKVIEYLQPEKKAKELLSSLGQGTSKDVTEELSKRSQLGKQSALSESLIPKKELFDKFGEEKLFKPELKYAESNIYKPPESKYLSDKNVDKPYSSNGELQSLHNLFKNDPTLNNYDSLQSAIKRELRVQEKSAKSGSDIANQKAIQLKKNIKNIDLDSKTFSNNLPEDYKNLDLEWRKKYAQGVPKFEEAGPTIKKLSSGDWQELTPSQITKAFTYDNKKTREVIKDLGPSAGKNILYLALQKVGDSDAEALGNAILDLKKNKGFDKFIDSNMEKQAKKLVSQSKHASLIKGALKGVGGAAAGGMIGGPFGAIIGGALPFGKEAVQLALKKYKK